LADHPATRVGCMDRTVTVTGHGTASAVPDTAVVRVAAVHRAPDIAAAFAGVASAASVVGRVALDYTDERRIASRDLNLWPAHDHQGRQAGFEARHAFEIGCPTVDAAGELLAALVGAVGDRLQVEGVTLQVSEPGALVTAAREAAYADATARATHLAGLAGATLGAIVSVAEGGGHDVPMVRAVSMKADSAGFQPGESSIGASVTGTWLLA